MRSESPSRRAAILSDRSQGPRTRAARRAPLRRTSSAGRVHGESIWPFFLAGALFAVLIAVAGPAAGAEPGAKPAAPGTTQTAQAPAVPAGGLDLSLDAAARPADPPTAPERFARATELKTDLAPNLHLRGLYRLQLTLYPDDQRAEAF